MTRGRLRLVGRIARRLLLALLVVWGVSLVTFIVARVLPGNPAYLIAGSQADEQTIQEATEQLGLDKPIVEQYWIYVTDLLSGDLGRSWTTANPVTVDLEQRLPATLELVVSALVLATVLSIVIGVAAARRPEGVVRRLADVLTAGGAAFPQFWLGLMLIYFFFFRLGWAPPPLGRISGAEYPPDVTGFLLIDTLLAGDLDAFRAAVASLVLPVITLAVTVQPPLLRLVQVSMTQTLESPPIRTARAMGLPFSAIVYHDALRLVLLPVLNLVGLLFGALISGAVLVEAVFSWPGIGQYAVQAINASDYSAVQGVVLVGAIAYVCVYLLLDVIQVLIDPRLRTVASN